MVPHVAVIRIGNTFGEFVSDHVRGHRVDTIGVRYGEWTQEKRIGKAEDSGVRTYPQRQRKHGNRSEAERTNHCAEGIAYIFG